MEPYLTINEFAKLRNVNANSLRYYEKLGILVPARTDPQTRYRYYLPEQLGILDTILLCIKLGIPLKNLNGYIDENGALDEQRILEDGRSIMEKKIADLQAEYELTRYNLKNMEENQRYGNKTGIYSREIEERYLIVRPYLGNWNDLAQKEKTVMELFHFAQKHSLVPVFPAGLLIHHETTPVSFSFFFQVLRPAPCQKQIVHIPRTRFSCLQADLTPETDLLGLLGKHFVIQTDKPVILSNLLLPRLHFESMHTEIQVACE